jgi:hypothetical protein
MLGKTHEVLAPTGLPKVMESAVGRHDHQESPPVRARLDRRCALALRRVCMECTPTDVGGAPAQRLAGARLQAPAGPPVVVMHVYTRRQHTKAPAQVQRHTARARRPTMRSVCTMRFFIDRQLSPAIADTSCPGRSARAARIAYTDLVHSRSHCCMWWQPSRWSSARCALAAAEEEEDAPPLPPPAAVLLPSLRKPLPAAAAAAAVSLPPLPLSSCSCWSLPPLLLLLPSAAATAAPARGCRP